MPKRSLILAGGGLKIPFQAGVLQVWLDEARIEFDDGDRSPTTGVTSNRSRQLMSTGRTYRSSFSPNRFSSWTSCYRRPGFIISRDDELLHPRVLGTAARQNRISADWVACLQAYCAPDARVSDSRKHQTLDLLRSSWRLKWLIPASS